MKYKIYRVTLTEYQLQLMAQCVEDLHRFYAGQMELGNTLPMLEDKQYEKVRKRLESCYPDVVPDLAKKLGYAASYGWNGGSCPNERQRVFLAGSYYLYREIYHQLILNRNIEDYNVYKSDTLRCADSGAPIKIERIK